MTIEEREAALIDAVQQLLDVALSSYQNRDLETFVECHVCGQWESHRRGCLVPALQRWQETPRRVPV